jgi:hypothetical protein
MIIDAWAQHPTLRHIQDPIFDSLRRWTKTETPTQELPVSVTIGAMDQAGVSKSLINAWVAPRNVMISNDEVLFGTNYPMITPAKALADLSTLGLDDQAKTLFLGENAQRVFKLAI